MINICNNRNIPVGEVVFSRSPMRKQVFKALRAEGYSYSEIASLFLSKPAPLVTKQAVNKALTQ